MLRAGSQVHIPVSGLGKPPGAKHSPAADGTLILLPGHGGQRFPLIGIVVEHLPGNAAGKFRAVEAVFMAFQRRVILPRAFFQVQHGADQRRVIGVAQRVVGGTGRLDAEHFHGGFQRFLGGGAVGLGIENHLGVVPLLRETLIQAEKPQIFPQNADIVKAPCEEHHVLAAPFPELFDRLGERHALIPQAGVAIGLAATGARTLGGEVGNALETIILASSVLYELIGPACAKLSLYLSGSYSNKLEDLAPIPATEPGQPPKSEVELLIERIQAIQQELPKHNNPYYEDEQAFTEAAAEHSAQMEAFFGTPGKANTAMPGRKRK